MSLSRRSFLAALALAVFASATVAEPASPPKSGKYWVYVGTYTSKDGSKGVYRCELDVNSGQLSEATLVAELGNPSFLAISPNGKYLYAATENIDELTLWTYEYPQCTLRFRQPFTFTSAPMPNIVLDVRPFIGRQAVLITEEGLIFEKTIMVWPAEGAIAEKRVAFYPGRGRNILDGNIVAGDFRGAATSNARIAVPVFQPDSVDVLVLNTDTGTDKCCVRLRGTKILALRMVEKTLLCADDLGRVLMLDISTGAVLRNLRV